MYEHRTQPPISRPDFIRRMLIHLAVAVGLILISLLPGIVGHGYFEGMPWPDAFFNAVMMLSGVGPVDAPQTSSGKLLTGIYALYAGFVFAAVISIMLMPVIHRVMHKFHWEKR